MTCPKCPNCGEQMVEEKVYGVKVCRCPACMYKQAVGTKSRESEYKEYVKKNPR